MARQIQVYVPLEKGTAVLLVLKSIPEAYGVAYVEGPTQSVLVCRANVKDVKNILRKLTEAGVGVTFGCIDISELMSTVPRLSHFKEEKKVREYRTTDRMSNEEIYQAIDKQIHLTFDYLLLLVAASLVSGAGLVQNSSAVVVASMIVSPLMAPLLGLTYGFYINDSKMLAISIRNTLIGILLVFITGFILGFASFPYFYLIYQSNGTEDDFNFVTYEMYSRGQPTSLIFGLLIAAPSVGIGVAVAIAVSGGVSSTLVGVAISAALLPPIVNSGLNLSLAIVCVFTNLQPIAREVLLIGLLSFALFFENVVVIFFTAIMTFKIKGIGPPAQESYHFNYESQHDQLASPIMTSNSMRDRERDDDEYIEFGEDVYSRSFDKGYSPFPSLPKDKWARDEDLKILEREPRDIFPEGEEFRTIPSSVGEESDDLSVNFDPKKGEPNENTALLDD